MFNSLFFFTLWDIAKTPLCIASKGSCQVETFGSITPVIDFRAGFKVRMVIDPLTTAIVSSWCNGLLRFEGIFQCTAFLAIGACKPYPGLPKRISFMHSPDIAFICHSTRFPIRCIAQLIIGRGHLAVRVCICFLCRLMIAQILIVFA